jgi:hypothetical protein
MAAGSRRDRAKTSIQASVLSLLSHWGLQKDSKHLQPQKAGPVLTLSSCPGQPAPSERASGKSTGLGVKLWALDRPLGSHNSSGAG